MPGMNIRWRRGYAYIWFSRTEWPPKGKMLSMKKIIGQQVTDKDMAERVLLSVKKNKLKSKLIELEGGHRISIPEFIEEYTGPRSQRADLDDNTLRMDRAVLTYLQTVTGKNTLRLINDDDLVDFKNHYLSIGRSPETIRSYFRALKAAFRYAHKKGHIKKVPDIPAVKAPKKQPRPISRDDLDKILTYTKEHDYELWRYAYFSAWTGCRQEECIRLKHQWITMYDVPTNGIVGRARVIGKRDIERTVFLIPQAMEAIGPVKDIGPVFKQWSGSWISHSFKKCVRAVGLEKPHFHDLRHTAATRMIEAGMPLEFVQKILGHADIRTTQIYAEIADKLTEEHMGKFGQVWT